METIFIIFVAILFLLAISDLIIGVSNDAVNFLNSALGSKAFPFWAVMIIASLGIIFGATFSNGMMEVARKGIFHPSMFSFSEIMVVFVAVMLTDILLLDLFNTLSLPTSTTVSIVFELLGAAVAVSVIKIAQVDSGDLNDYINSGKALAIIAGILLSVIVAFTMGMIVQYLTRIVFTFNYGRTIKYFGSLWGAIAITAIVYFILIKGAKGSSIISEAQLTWIKTHTLELLGMSFAFWLILLQLFDWFTKINILRLIIMVGTFALAMAFAGNDLVNFIGVPLAGLKSYQTWAASGSANPDAFSMGALQAEVETHTIYLMLAGIIMVVTLWFSRKAHSVTQTEINLSRQNEGYERFGSSGASRSLVRFFIIVNNFFLSITPKSLQNAISRRFEEPKEEIKNDKASYDMIRASVNLTVASIIISFATSLTLPLSTTYVTFMVAMGSSLSDGAWGRESAVYRVTGVLSVVGGWFFTAIIAFSAAFLFAILIHWGGIYIVGILLGLAIFLIIRTQLFHASRMRKEKRYYDVYEDISQLDDKKVFDKCNDDITSTLVAVSRVYKQTILGVSNEDRKQLKSACNETEDVANRIRYQKNNVHLTVRQLQADSIDTGHFYVQELDYLKEIINSLKHIARPSYDHILNNHRGLEEMQARELMTINTDVRELYKNILRMITEHKYNELDVIVDEQQRLLEKIQNLRKKQLKRIKNNQATSTKNNLLYLDILSETKNIILYSVNLLKSHRDFVIMSEKTLEYF